MKLTPPKKNTFIVALVIALLALVSKFVEIPFVTQYQFWVMFVAYALLAAGNYLPGF